MNSTRRSFIGATLGVLAAPAFAEAITDAYPLWEIRRGDAKVYLLGDCGSVTDPWRSGRAERAFSESAVFWKEMPDVGPAEAAKFSAQGADRERRLSTRLTPSQMDRVAEAARIVGASLPGLETCRPWLAAAALTQRDAARYPPGSDPLQVLSTAAQASAKPIRTEFPDVDALVESFASMPEGAQVEYLMNTVDGIEAGPELWSARQAAWARGDLSEETRRVLHEMETYPAGYEAGTGRRNRRWPARFKAMLSAGGVTFVGVGVTHLMGPEGVLALVSREGLSLRRL